MDAYWFTFFYIPLPHLFLYHPKCLPNSKHVRIYVVGSIGRHLTHVGCGTHQMVYPFYYLATWKIAKITYWHHVGEKLNKLEKEKRIIIRFVIGHSATPRGVLDRAIDMEEEKYKDFLRLNHVEGYHELSIKTRLYFSKVVSIWDAEFYVKVDDDVHVNLGMLMTTLARYRSKPRTYLGCMKSGPVLFQKSVCFHWSFLWFDTFDGVRIANPHNTYMNAYCSSRWIWSF